jgi:hypothetical protein
VLHDESSGAMTREKAKKNRELGMLPRIKGLFQKKRQPKPRFWLATRRFNLKSF